jgi:hypothetical protein
MALWSSINGELEGHTLSIGVGEALQGVRGHSLSSRGRRSCIKRSHFFTGERSSPTAPALAHP